jgi:hypothetical protein
MTGKEVRVNITDLSGKIVYTATPTQTERFEINTANLAEGVYFINIQAADLFETKKVKKSEPSPFRSGMARPYVCAKCPRENLQ